MTALSNGNYVTHTPNWDNGAVVNAGAVTWCNGLGGTVGVVSVANSLTGSVTEDFIGNNITALTNGNYVVGSLSWKNTGGVERVPQRGVTDSAARWARSRRSTRWSAARCMMGSAIL